MDLKLFHEYFHGYIEVQEDADGYLRPQRFSRKQNEYYEAGGYYRCICTTGLMFKADVCNHVSFSYKAYDELGLVFLDVVYKEMQKIEHMELAAEEGRIEIDGKGAGVEIYFGYQNMLGFKDIRLDAIPIPKFEKSILCFGDSITHGYCVQNPMDTFPAVLGRAFDAEVYNFGIGGHYADRRMLDDLYLLPKPALITFGYGTNDWNFEKDSKEDIAYIFSEFNRIYSDVPVFVLLPTPRRTERDVKKYGTLEEFRQWIAKTAEEYKNIWVINSGQELVVDKHMVNDGIHPNNDGMHLLSAYILHDIRKIMKEAKYV